MKMKSIIKIVSVFCLITLIFFSCGSREERLGRIKNNHHTEVSNVNIKENTSGDGKTFTENIQYANKPILETEIKDCEISKVTFFIENSGSIKGYVEGGTQYVNVLTNIANHPDFVKENIRSLFYLTSGISTPEKVTNLSQSLVPASFNQTRSNLNQLFKTTLDSVSGNRIAILISDGIYDMCPNPIPLSTLQTLGYELRRIFINKLMSSDFQTILVKLQSNFIGRYYPGYCCDAYSLNQIRPYYLWIFGETDILKKYFSDGYLENLDGYVNSARYFKYDLAQDIYNPNSHKRIGSYHPSKNDRYTLEDVRTNASNVFQFSIAVDFSQLPLNDNYLKDTSNYVCTNGFTVVSIDSPTDVANLGFPDQTHLIVVKKIGNPIGKLTVSLLNRGYDWISSTNIDNDCNISGNVNQTFGFEVLNMGMIEAYQSFNPGNEIFEFNINLKN
jgi:hypothetical protein